MSSEVEIVETLPPMHPGEAPREEFMLPFSVRRADRQSLRRAADPDRTDRRRGNGDFRRYGGAVLPLFRHDPEFWMNLQTRFELATVERKFGAELAKIAPYASP